MMNIFVCMFHKSWWASNCDRLAASRITPAIKPPFGTKKISFRGPKRLIVISKPDRNAAAAPIEEYTPAVGQPVHTEERAWHTTNKRRIWYKIVDFFYQTCLISGWDVYFRSNPSAVIADTGAQPII